jgi:hypothetical protein
MQVKREIKSAMDLMAVYVSPQVGVGQRRSLSTIQERLSWLPLNRVLEILAQVAFRADKAMSEQDSIDLAKVLLRPVYAQKTIQLIQSNTRERYFAVSSQVVVGLALQALLHCPDGDSDIKDEELIYEIGDLLLSLAGTVEHSGMDRDSALLEMVRMDIWYRLRDLDKWYEVAHALIFDILPTLTSDPDWIDTRKLIEDATGLDLELYWALTSALAINTDNSAEKGYIFPPNIISEHISHEQVKKWTDFWTIDVEDAKTHAAEDVKDEFMWSFSAFYDRPLTRLSNGEVITIRPWFVDMKATPNGFFNTIDRINREQGGSYTRWARFFGRATEILGRKFISDYAPTLKRMDESDIAEQWGKGKVCDCVLLDDDWIALDFVFRRISKQTTTTGSVTDLALDLDKGVLGKLLQIDETLSKGLAKVPAPKGNIFPLVVVCAPFPVNGILLAEVDTWVFSEKRKVIGTNPACREPMIIDLEEFWALLESAAINNLSPAQMLRMWSDSVLKVSSFRNWLVTSELKPVPLEGKRRYHKHAIKHLFGKDI